MRIDVEPRRSSWQMEEHHSRNARTGPVLVVRQAGKKHAAVTAYDITRAGHSRFKPGAILVANPCLGNGSVWIGIRQIGDSCGPAAVTWDR